MSGNDTSGAGAQGDEAKPAENVLNKPKTIDVTPDTIRHLATALVAEMMAIDEEMKRAAMPQTQRKDVNDSINPAWGSLYLLADETPELVRDEVDGHRIVYTDMLNLNIDDATLQVKDGVLTADAVPAAAMVQKYGNLKVLKCPDQLKAAVKFARQLPITDDHPKADEITSQKEIKGWSSVLAWDEANKAVTCRIEITDPELVAKVQGDDATPPKRGLSIGFRCELDMRKGKYGAEDYDAKQTDIVLNHIAVVDQGRCPIPKCALGIKPLKKPDAADAATAPAPAPAGEDAAKGAAEAKVKEEVVLLKVHEDLLTEKVAAIKAAAEKLIAGVATMTQEEFSKVVSAIESLSWDMRKLRETLAGVGSAGPIVAVKADAAIKAADAELAKAKAGLATFNALVDKVMDAEPPFTREFAERRPRTEIDTLARVAGSKEKPIKQSDSSTVTDMESAYRKRVLETTGG